MLSCKKLTYSIADKTLFKDFSHNFKSGMITAIKGANGSGKTSLLELLAGFREADQGEVLFAKEPLREIIDDYYENLRFIGHQRAIKENLTVLQNISFWSELVGNEMLIAAAIRYFALEDIIDKKISSLSAGQKKLVDLTKLLTNPGKIWLLDEPFENLDNKNQEKLKDLIEARAGEGSIIIFTTHQNIKFDSEKKFEELKI